MKSAAFRRRNFWKLALPAFAAAALVAAAIVALRDAPRGNVVLIVIDTLRADALGCYGGKTATPRIDALAEAGKRYDPVVGSFHQTTASMGAMFTGLVPSLESGDAGVLPWTSRTWCGMYRLGTGEEGSQCLPTSRPTLPELLQAAGYRTIGVNSNSLLFRPAGFDRGFDTWVEVGSRDSKPEGMSLAEFARAGGESRSAPHVIRAALEALVPSTSAPTFLYVHFMDVHDWWTPGDPRHNANRVQNYAPAVARMDTHVGKLLDSLAETGLLQDATVVLTADHGEALREPHPVTAQPTHGGNPTYETVARIPLIVVPAAGRAMPEPVVAFGERPLRRTADIRDLVLALAAERAEMPSPQLLEDDEVFYTEAAYRTLRSGDWKISCPRNLDVSSCILFELASDPHERTDVSGANPDVVRELTTRMGDLARKLAPPADSAGGGDAGEVSEEERERLQALGYLQ